MVNPVRPFELVYEGLRNPYKVPPYLKYLKRKLFPSKYSPKKVEDGIVTWNTEAGFGWGAGDKPPQISAINYHMVQALREDLKGNEYQHAVEIGCGYGRVTPWLSGFAEEVTGIDPNENVLSIANEYYPEINTISAKAQNLPIPDDAADLLFTRSVLQHIPSRELQQTIDEMERIADDDAHILICEATKGKKGETYYPRSKSEYSRLFKDFQVESSWRRDTPAAYHDKSDKSRMFFKQNK